MSRPPRPIACDAHLAMPALQPCPPPLAGARPHLQAGAACPWVARRWLLVRQEPSCGRKASSRVWEVRLAAPGLLVHSSRGMLAFGYMRADIPPQLDISQRSSTGLAVPCRYPGPGSWSEISREQMATLVVTEKSGVKRGLQAREWIPRGFMAARTFFLPKPLLHSTNLQAAGTDRFSTPPSSGGSSEGQRCVCHMPQRPCDDGRVSCASEICTQGRPTHALLLKTICRATWYYAFRIWWNPPAPIPRQPLKVGACASLPLTWEGF